MSVASLLVLTSGLIDWVALLGQQVDAAPAQKNWLGLVIMLVLLIGVLVASVWSSKRGHQD